MQEKRVLVKICGLSQPATLEVALSAGADMVGFVFFPKSPRHLSLERARELSRLVAGRARKVALSVDADDDELARIIEATRPDALQLHGHESPDRTGAIRSRFGVPVLKAISVSQRGEAAKADAYWGVADTILFDAKPSPDALAPGGNGLSFDWDLLAEARLKRPFFLSGGLTSDNVAEAIARTGASGVDVSSGVESAPGVKDGALIRRFIAAARGLPA